MNREEFNSLFYEFYRTYWGDKRGVVPPGVNIQRQVIDLSAARNGEELRVDGDFLYADPLSTGQCSIAYGQAMPPFPFRASTGIKGFPFKTLLLTNAAQPGLALNLWYGYGAQVIPPNQDIANIGSITNPVDISDREARILGFTSPRGIRYGVSFYSTAALAANVSQQVVAPGTNVNGITIWRASGFSRNGASLFAYALQAHTAAPNGFAVGDILASPDFLSENGALFGETIRVEYPIFVPAGLGIYFTASVAEGIGMRSVLYTVH